MNRPANGKRPLALVSMLLVAFVVGLSLRMAFKEKPSTIYNEGVKKLLTESPSDSNEYLLAANLEAPREMYLVAYNFFLEGNHSRSKDLVSTILTMSPNKGLEGACYYLLGMISRSSGNIDLEMSNFIRAIGLSDGRDQQLFRLELAYSYLTLKDFAKCQEILTECKPLLTGNDAVRWHQIMIRFCIGKEQYDEALKLAKEMSCESSPRCVAIKHIELAYCYLRLKDIQAATVELEEIDSNGYSDSYIESVVDVYRSAISGGEIKNVFPNDRVYSEMVDWFIQNYGSQSQKEEKETEQ